jgi:predicted metal-dependent HD superfamily phosphohydrolase
MTPSETSTSWIVNTQAQDSAATPDQVASWIRQITFQLSAGTRIPRLCLFTFHFSVRRCDSDSKAEVPQSPARTSRTGI